MMHYTPHEITAGLSQELALELLAAYEDRDFFALEPSIKWLAAARDLLASENVTTPDVVNECIAKYQQSKQIHKGELS